MAATEARIEIVGERRRVHDAAFRARVVAEASVPGARMRDLARRHGLCTSLIYRWRRDAIPRETAAVRPEAAGPTRPGEPRGATSALEFVPSGVLGQAADGGPALVAKPSAAGMAPSPSGSVPLPRPAMEGRTGVIEIDLADGTRLRADTFVNERALQPAGLGEAREVAGKDGGCTRHGVRCRPPSRRIACVQDDLTPFLGQQAGGPCGPGRLRSR